MDINTWKQKAQRLFDQLPNEYWLFAADGKLHIMKYDADGGRAIENDGGMDHSHLAGTLTGPEIDGGDW